MDFKPGDIVMTPKGPVKIPAVWLWKWVDELVDYTGFYIMDAPDQILYILQRSECTPLTPLDAALWGIENSVKVTK